MPDKKTYRDITFYPDAETVPGLLIYRFDSALFFSNAEYFTSEIRRNVAVAKIPVQQVLINAETINDLDTTGTDQLIKLHEGLEKKGIGLSFAKVRDPVREMMRLSGAEEVIGPNNFYASVSDGVRAFIQSQNART